jgi:hypothetical protein
MSFVREVAATKITMTYRSGRQRAVGNVWVFLIRLWIITNIVYGIMVGIVTQ